jgi:hypothetical protein
MAPPFVCDAGHAGQSAGISLSRPVASTGSLIRIHWSSDRPIMIHRPFIFSRVVEFRPGGNEAWLNRERANATVEYHWYRHSEIEKVRSRQ